ncbi:MAG: alanine racemase [Actinomycetota bacterium]|jgi:alanine racemase
MREIQVDLGRIQTNYRTLKQLAQPAKVMAVVKANAYGHGMHEVAQALEEIGVDALGVADLNEAIELRSAGIKTRIMCWLLQPSDDFQLAKDLEIELGVSSFEVLTKVLEVGVHHLHVKVDTGLGRNGFVQADWERLFSALAGKSISLFSHLANTSEEADLKQQAEFEAALEVASVHGVEVTERHLAATAGTLSYPAMRYEMVRVGIGVYGLNPDEREFATFGLRPAMRVVARVANFKRVEAGQGVSYGYRYVTQRPTNLILVPFGYAEGMPRIAQGAKVLVAGKSFEISGRIAMDQFVVDVGDLEVSIGDEVVIFGDAENGEPTAEELGASYGSINYEVVTRIGGRAQRVYKK